MTKVKSISIEGSSPTPIVDKGIDEAQTRSTVSVTDVVKVQDGNGIWHAIPFNKFMEVATPLVASIMNNVNLQGNIKKFLGLDANGNPGVSTIADAASVLGVASKEIFENNYDLNNAPVGIVKSNNGNVVESLQNAPIPSQRANFMCETQQIDGAYRFQTFWYTAATWTAPKIYVRCKTQTSGWTQWSAIIS